MATHYTHTEEYIKTFYTKIDILKPQELKFQTIAERLGINVFYWPETSQALFTGNKSFILLNEKLTSQQQWQDFCHELAHVLLHTGNQRTMPESFRTYQEAKANTFMYHAAVPTFMIHDLHIEDATRQNIHLVQQLFNVEYDFASIRLTHYLNRQRDMLNWNTYFYGE